MNEDTGFRERDVLSRLLLELEEKNAELEDIGRELQRANAANAVLEERLHHVLTSTTWRMTRFQRKLLQMLPSRVRHALRGLVASTYRFLKRNVSRRVTANEIGGAAGMKDPVVAREKDYNYWVETYDTLSDVDRSKIADRIRELVHAPLISVVVPIYETQPNVLRGMIDSILKQLYSNWELCLADDASKSPHVRAMIDAYAAKDKRIKCIYRETNGHISAASNSALSLASGEYIALVDHDDVLPEHALYMVADAIARNPTADIFYSDEDKLDSQGRRNDPNFKPDWNPQLFSGQNYLNHLTVYKRSIVTAIGGFRLGYEGSQDYDLALRVIAATSGPVVHIPHVLYHWRIYPGAGTMSSSSLQKALASARLALVEHHASRGVTVSVRDVMGSYHRVMLPDPAPWPKVSVIIPTRDHLDDLEVVVSGLLKKTDYPDLQIIIADNDSAAPETLSYFAECERIGVQTVKCPGPFNYSGINNSAIAQSDGELVLLLNNDISFIDEDWLKEMVRHLSDPTIAIVGPKLLYPDGTLQHAGVVLGIGGVAGHRYVGHPGNATGQFGQLSLAQDVSCVTGACLLIRRAVFDAVGGLDDKLLPVAFNDVDLCMRVRKAGHRIVWTPNSTLYHHESKSRGSDLEGAKLSRFITEVQQMKTRWGEKLRKDPFFSPNLSLNTTNPAFAFPPRVEKPWFSDVYGPAMMPQTSLKSLTDSPPHAGVDTTTR